MKTEKCICGDIVSELPLAQATVSQHLKELKNTELIKGNIEGAAICYCIDESGLQKLQNYFNEIMNEIQKKKIQCC